MLVTRVSYIYLVDEFFVFGLVEQNELAGWSYGFIFFVSRVNQVE